MRATSTPRTMPIAAPSAPTIIPDSNDAASCSRTDMPMRVQQRNFAASARHRERLRGVDQERTGEERDQRERRQVRAVRAGQAHGIVRRLARRDDLRTRRQQGDDGGANGSAVGCRRESKIDAIESAQPLQPPLRLADVQQSDGLGICTGRQYASDAETHAIERHLHVEIVTDLEFQ